MKLFKRSAKQFRMKLTRQLQPTVRVGISSNICFDLKEMSDAENF